MPGRPLTINIIQHNNNKMAQSYARVRFYHKGKNQQREFTFTPAEITDLIMYINTHRLAYLLPELEELEDGVLISENTNAKLSIEQFCI
jgi:hypothetical protein